ncbi:MAG: VOC family protein [Betaproteobacteria bacterium]|jgi:catechol 2,3-dioxygenase-like lactoylglutathione lyase family enzyme|nr:VOC family protein [Betaproteobacteria bacterium]
MKLEGTLLVVKDINASRRFYQDVLSRKVVLDLGVYVVFEEGLYLLTEGQWIEFLDSKSVPFNYGNNVCQLGFEDGDIDAFMAHFRKFPDIKVLTPLKEYAWGQRSIRFYDPDGHVIEVGESMTVVVKRFLRSGLSVEETMQKTMFPREFVEMCAKE